MNNKIFMVGDFFSNSGPAIANRNLVGNDLRFVIAKASHKFDRIIEVIVNVHRYNYICLCSFSKLNYIVIILSKLLNKKIIYFVHGIVSFEYKVNNKNMYSDKKYLSFYNDEKYYLKCSDLNIFVSELQKRKIREIYGDTGNCFVNYDVVKNDGLYSRKKKMLSVVSFGGTVKEKNNIVICEAIQKIINEYNINLKYIIVGNIDEDLDKFTKYEFLEISSTISHEEAIAILSSANLYIQNSYFETFGMSIIEALYCGCDVLFTKNMGCLEIFDNVNSGDIIENNECIDEIVQKIIGIIQIGNNERLLNEIELNKINDAEVRETFYQKCINLQ